MTIPTSRSIEYELETSRDSSVGVATRYGLDGPVINPGGG
jgi:hypothetical protein